MTDEDRIILEVGSLLPSASSGDLFSMLRVQTLQAELAAIREGRPFTEADRKKAADRVYARWDETIENEARALVAISRLNHPTPKRSWWRIWA